MQLKPFYEVTRRDYRGQHLYAITGEPEMQDLKSVTHYTGVIDKPALINWAVREAMDGVRRELYLKLGKETHASVELDIDEIDRMLECAMAKPERIKTGQADLGTLLHQAIDVFVTTGQWPDICQDIRPGVDGFIKWFGAGRDIILGDTYVASRRYSYGGAFDAIERRADGLWLLDWKRTNGLWPEMAVQVGGGYTLAFEETYGVRPAGATIARFGKTKSEFEALDVANISIAQAAFLHCRGLKTALASDLYVQKREVKPRRKPTNV